MGYAIKQLREELGISQVKLSELSGISRATINALENGTERTTTVKTLERLAESLNTTVDKLFFNESVK